MLMFSRLMWIASLLTLALASPPADKCVCLPGQACWPSVDDWNAFNSTVDGKLEVVYPVGTPCHDPTFDNSTCQAVIALFTNSSWRSDQIGALQQPNFEVNAALNETCYVDSNRTIPCAQGNLPVYGVAVESADQVSTAIKFACSRNLRLVIKNTGHDYLGRSTGAGSLSIWTHKMQNISFSKDFIPQGSDTGVGTTVTLGAGVRLKELYYAVGQQNQSVVAGMASTVGAAGGYIQGGGHSPMANLFGMSTDNAVEYQLVTAKGEFVVANDYQNQDLFWALRGGGGGTFGVVIAVTLKTFPEPPFLVQNLNVTFPDVKSLYNFTTSYLKALPAIDDAGGSGYYYLDPYGAILNISEPTFIVVHYFFNKTNITAINTLFAPLYAVVNSINGTKSVNVTISVPQARYAFPQPNSHDSTGGNVILGSRLYSRRNLETENGAANLANAIQNITDHYPTIIEGHLTAGGKVAANADKVDSALNPSWRLALGEIIIPISWEDSTPYAVQQQLMKNLTDIEVPILAAVDPTMGAYTNEADANEPQWQTVFWGTNYPRLLQVKNKWDPRGLLRCNRCVGSERWDATGNCPAS